MSRFKAGDRVRCVDAGRAASLVFGTEYTVSRVMDGCDARTRICADGAVSDCDWWYEERFELVSPPQSVESPDEWVEITDPNHAIRKCDQISDYGTQWYPPSELTGALGKLLRCISFSRCRCRRRDYPQRPVEVHAGGPYVARSEYERVCLERDKLQDDQKNLLADLKDIEQTVIHLNKRVFANNPNGWPLVPVDPSCIPDGYRAVEVTTRVKGKFVACPKRTIFMHNAEQDYPRLVVEPIPTPAPDALPRPEFPAWIRAGWWVAMDAGGFWYMSENEPIATEPVLGSTADSGTWNPPNGNDVGISDHTPSMHAIPTNRWREAKWQVE